MAESRIIQVKKDERPTIKSLFDCLEVGDTLSIDYDFRVHAAVRQECFRQNEIARAVGGEMNLFFRTAKKGDQTLIYRLK